MKIIESNNSQLTYSGANTRYFKILLILVSILYPIALLLAALMIFSGDDTLFKLMGCIFLLLVTAAVVLVFITYQRSKNITYKINKINSTVEVNDFKYQSLLNLGEFLNLAIRGYSIPKWGMQYHLFLIGSQNESKLGVVSNTKNGILKKSKPIIDFLSLELEVDEKVGSYADLLKLTSKKQDSENKS